MRTIFRLCAKSTFRLALAAAAAQDMAGFGTDLPLDDLDDVVDDPLVLLAFLTVVVGLLMDVFEVFGADTCVGVDVDDDDDDDDDEADDVQWTGGFGKAVGAGAS